MSKKPKIRTTKSMDERFLGSEPKNDIFDKMQTAHAYNYFNYFYKMEDAVKFFEKYLETYDVSLIRKFRAFPTSEFSMNIGWIARMKTNQVSLTPETDLYFDRFITKLKEFQHVTKEDVVKKPLYKDNFILNQLEAEHDKLVGNLEVYNFDCLSFFRNHNPTQIDIKKIHDYYLPIFEEINNVITDKNYREGYEKYSKKELANLLRFYGDIINSTKDIKTEKARTRKPRAIKAVPIKKLVQKLRFMTKDNALNISGLPPEKILNSGVLLLYNTRLRKIYLLEANGAFEPKGVSLMNINPEKSFAKTVRKPELVKEFLTGTKSAIIRKFEELKTTPASFDRFTTNVDTLILRNFI